MDYRYLGRSGFRVPALSLGTATFGGKGDFFAAWGDTGAEQATRLVDMCLDFGLNMFDSADVYSAGLAEEILGAAIKGKRDRVIISTKATFRSGDGPNDVGSSRYHLINACEKALKRLRTDYIDIFQLHGFDARTPIEETLSALDDLVRAGKIRYVGCSNFSGWHLMKSLAVAERYKICHAMSRIRPIIRWPTANMKVNSCPSGSTRGSARSSGAPWRPDASPARSGGAYPCLRAAGAA
jgi:aryl-alcohol dehydrogenase-like predicted oxidoreductase